MEGKIELTDPDHPEAEKAAEATARLLIQVRETRTKQEAAEATPVHEGSHLSPSNSRAGLQLAVQAARKGVGPKAKRQEL